MRRALFAIVLAGCAADAPSGVASDYTLQKLDALAGEHHVVGVDVDSKGDLWLAYQIQSDTFVWEELRLVHMDRHRTILDEVTFEGTGPKVSGIAVDGGALWLNLTMSGDDRNPRVRKVALGTGETLAELPTEAGIEDIAIRDNTLLLSNLWREVVAIDKTTGEAQWRSAIPALEHSECRGIASTRDGTWIVSLTEARIVLVDDAGTQIESAAFPEAEDYWSVEDGLHLAHDGTSFVFHRRNQILWYGRPE
jgi:outer membrane protein assembly factor BamB